MLTRTAMLKTLEPMLDSLDSPPQFQRETIAYYRRMALDMLQEPIYRAFRNDLFTAVRAITDWRRLNSDDFHEFYAVYAFVTRILDDVKGRAEATLELEPVR